jgi:hypothetical protein
LSICKYRIVLKSTLLRYYDVSRVSWKFIGDGELRKLEAGGNVLLDEGAGVSLSVCEGGGVGGRRASLPNGKLEGRPLANIKISWSYGA